MYGVAEGCFAPHYEASHITIEGNGIMTYAQALILGLVQGLTEFLPVSSSGHLVLFQQWFGLGEEMLNFDIFVHFGTLLAVLVVFRSTIATMLFGSIRDVRAYLRGGVSIFTCIRDSRELRLLLAVVLGTIPAVLVGLTLKDSIETLFSSVVPVLFALGITGIFLIMTFFIIDGNGLMGPGRGFIVGVAQALAIVPGISRSGATISTAMFLGIKRSEAGEFSFILSIPAILGATVLAAHDMALTGMNDTGPLVLGMIASFLSGWVSLHLLMHIVRRGKIGWFGFYCLAVVAAGVILYTTGAFSPSSKAVTGTETHVEGTIVTIDSSFDGMPQHIKYYEAGGSSRPLLVALHTWSFDYTQDSVSSEYFKRCRERDWHCIFPDFRGANNKPSACGSEAAVRDILDAVEWAQDTFDVDHRRIFLVGGSGGGHMTLQAAGKSPSTWTAISAWVPITDLKRWHEESIGRGLAYAEHIELSCGGPPGASPEVDRQYRERSPMTNIWRASIIPADINAGIHDGHGGELGGEGSVPVGHSIRAFNELARAAGKPSEMISEDVIGMIEDEETVPDYVLSETAEDPLYGCKIHLRRSCGLSRLTLFEGGHEILYDAAFAWFDRF